MTKPNRIQSWQLGGDPCRAVAIRKRLPCQYLSQETSTEKKDPDIFHQIIIRQSWMITSRISGYNTEDNLCILSTNKYQCMQQSTKKSGKQSHLHTRRILSVFNYIYIWMKTGHKQSLLQHLFPVPNRQEASALPLKFDGCNTISDGSLRAHPPCWR